MKKEELKCKTYLSPSLEVVETQTQTVICISPAGNQINNYSGYSWD